MRHFGLLLLFVAATSAAAQTPDGKPEAVQARKRPPLEHAMELQAHGSLDSLVAARELLVNSDSARYAAHIASIDSALPAVMAFRMYVKHNHPRMAQAVLDSLRATVQDAGLQLHVAKLRKELKMMPIRARAGGSASGFAAAVFGDVARTLKNAAARASTTILYIIVFIVAILILQQLARFVRGPRPGVHLAIDDMIAPADLQARESRRLSRQVQRHIRDLARGNQVSTVDRLEDLDGVAGVRPTYTLAQRVEDHIGGEDIEVGPIRFAPKQVANLLIGLGERLYEREVTGYMLQKPDGAALLYVEQKVNVPARRTGKEAARSYGPWTHENADRDRAIREFALKYVFDTACVSPAANWPSFRDYCSGMELLETGTTPDDLRAARISFESALRHDRNNWLARFKLAEVLRRQGKATEAIGQFEEVERLISADEKERSSALNDFLGKQPHFELMLRYNKAITRTRTSRVGDIKNAIAELDALIGALNDIPTEAALAPAGGEGGPDGIKAAATARR